MHSKNVPVPCDKGNDLQPEIFIWNLTGQISKGAIDQPESSLASIHVKVVEKIQKLYWRQTRAPVLQLGGLNELKKKLIKAVYDCNTFLL